MNKIKPDVDVIQDLLKKTLEHYPTSKFITSLLFQYQERGSLSKKQLEGLHSKATNVKDIPPGKLATLEAIILKKPTRFKSPPPSLAPEPEKDILLEKRMDDILGKYPLHKGILFLKTKFDNNEAVSIQEKAEIERLHKLLIK